MGALLSAAVIGGAVGGSSGAALYYNFTDDEDSRRKYKGSYYRCAGHTAACCAGAAGGVACLPFSTGVVGLLFGGSAVAPGAVLCEVHRACGANVLTGFLVTCAQERSGLDGSRPDEAPVEEHGAADPYFQGMHVPTVPATPLLSRLRQPPAPTYTNEMPGLFTLPAENGQSVLCHWTPAPGPRVGEGRPAVALYLHSEFKDLGSSVQECSDIAETLSCAVLAVEYSGFGATSSTSSTSSAGAHGATAERYLSRQDIDDAAAAALRYLTDTLGVPPQRVIICGRGGGCGPACATAAAASAGAATPADGAGIGGLLLIDPPATVRGGAVEGWATLALVRQCLCPLLILAGANDMTNAEWVFVAASAVHVRGAGTLVRYFAPGVDGKGLRVTHCAHPVAGPFLGIVAATADRERIPVVPHGLRPQGAGHKARLLAPGSA
eukprot:TRINITY_DN46880_c0_g1_i1.p1 TRINITY_DN46880_c0_g1~~TRINITY_DN46880_c0_g1_i1.p1  ORF type:complete len:437 (+),score=104.42 TRINITY_DN46880_c0_g1_i1:177-1487(+)